MKTKAQFGGPNRHPCPRWNPYQTFVWDAKDMRAWVDECGAWGQYDGKRWRMIYKRLCPGRYAISFKECE